MRHLMSPLDFSVEELDKLLDLANDIEAHPQKYAHKCDGKKLATCFYEPSTRTRLSFEAAMLNLGGSVLGFHSADSSSASKGESVSDTIRIISCYADICAMRHPKEGAPLVASQKSLIPVINAGDGGHQHPTQTLTDLLTIRSLKGRLDNITIGFCGDLKFGRTVHSLINALIRYDNVKIVLISPEELKVPDYVRDDVLRANNIEFKEVEKLEDAIGELDVLYMTRVQRERFFNEEDYVRLKDFYVLTRKKMELAREDMLVLHPLPRVNEISVEVDDDPVEEEIDEVAESTTDNEIDVSNKKRIVITSKIPTVDDADEITFYCVPRHSKVNTDDLGDGIDNANDINIDKYRIYVREGDDIISVRCFGGRWYDFDEDAVVPIEFLVGNNITFISGSDLPDFEDAETGTYYLLSTDKEDVYDAFIKKIGSDEYSFYLRVTTVPAYTEEESNTEEENIDYTSKMFEALKASSKKKSIEDIMK